MGHFNKNIRYYRKKRRLTQDAFAEYLGIKKGKLIAWENKSEPKFGELVRICELLKVNLIDFITQEITDKNKHEFFDDKNSSTKNFNDPLSHYGKDRFNLFNQNIEDLDVFSIIDRVIYTNDANSRRELAEALKTEVGKLLLDLAKQKDKNILLLEKESERNTHMEVDTTIESDSEPDQE
ncbi:MAG: helix-turn-helix transcriptional regulator [Bacteroidota bacterium]